MKIGPKNLKMVWSVERMEEGRLTRRIYKTEIDGARRRGRLRRCRNKNGAGELVVQRCFKLEILRCW